MDAKMPLLFQIMGHATDAFSGVGISLRLIGEGMFHLGILATRSLAGTYSTQCLSSMP